MLQEGEGLPLGVGLLASTMLMMLAPSILLLEEDLQALSLLPSGGGPQATVGVAPDADMDIVLGRAHCVSNTMESVGCGFAPAGGGIALVAAGVRPMTVLGCWF